MKSLVNEKSTIFDIEHILIVSGTKCSVMFDCPISGLKRHNAVVLGIESSSENTVCDRCCLNLIRIKKKNI